MKKIFTLIAVAFAALSVNAQNLWKSEAGVEVTWEWDDRANTMVEASAFSTIDMKVGDKIKVTCIEKTVDDSSWPQISLRYGWGGTIGTILQLWDFSSFPQTGEVTLTEDNITTIKEQGIYLAGSGGKVSSIDYEAAEVPEWMDLTGAIWVDTSAPKIDNWGNMSLSASAFSSLVSGKGIEFRLSEWNDGTIVQVFPGGWGNESFNSSGGRFVVDKEKKICTFVPTDTEIELIVKDGVVIQGVDASIYAIALFTDDPNKEVVKELDLPGTEGVVSMSEDEGSSGWHAGGWIGLTDLAQVYKSFVVEFTAEHEFALVAQNWVDGAGTNITVCAEGTSEKQIISIPVGSEEGQLQGLGQYAIQNRYITEYYEPSMGEGGKMVDESLYGANMVTILRAYLTNKEVESTYTPWVDPTGISNVSVAYSKSNVMYNIAGQRVNNAKGFVIMNGKKYVVK